MYGTTWEGWRQCLEGWLSTQDKALSVKLNAANWFVRIYLPKTPEPAVISSFFRAGEDGLLPDLVGVLTESMNDDTATKNANWIFDLIEHTLDEYLSEVDDRGVPVRIFGNPFARIKQTGVQLAESVYTAMPYAYIRELRSLLCPVKRGNFADWDFAQEMSGQPTADGRSSAAYSDWIEVGEGTVLIDDPDSVYRTRKILRKGQRIEITELWSPVRAVALYLKLELPLRTHQVRMLDSGEADTFRYVNGAWVKNARAMSYGRESNPYSRGVFMRKPIPMTGEIMTGLFISTNKTADINKDSRERGYEIPWQHDNVLYWLEKLRNWQEKHNPISAPTACTSLEEKHFGSTKSQTQKEKMGFMCFLFRDPTAKLNSDRDKPIIKTALEGHWYKLLAELENRVADRGQTLDNGERITFVNPPVKGVLSTGTFFPLHSLRVSLISSFIMEGGVPLPAMSKLLAGHSRLLMTLRYTQVSIAKMTALLNEASENIEKSELQSLQTFIRDSSWQQISASTSFHDESSIRVATASRNPVGWEYRHLGLCLVGGNNTYLDDASFVNGCWNGGAEVPGSKPVRHDRVHHGDGNCACCRFLITDASYLPQWIAHFNIVSYRASLAAETAIAAEQDRDELKDELFYATEHDIPFTRQAELAAAERRFTQQDMEVRGYAVDLQYCFKMIARIQAVEEGREEGDQGQKLIATGALDDITIPLTLIETKSELWQLSVILDDAEIYPDEVDHVLKSPAIHRRSRQLNRLLMRNDYAPIFLNMSDKMQLTAGNAMMRAMAQAVSPGDRLEGYRQVSELVEAAHAIPQLQDGVDALKRVAGEQVFKMKDLITKQGASDKLGLR
ncbi:hypothetical protein IFT69_24465 [Pseudomonas putida]|nr:hypothetical protein [Pseudomonas putida]